MIMMLTRTIKNTKISNLRKQRQAKKNPKKTVHNDHKCQSNVRLNQDSPLGLIAIVHMAPFVSQIISHTQIKAFVPAPSHTTSGTTIFKLTTTTKRVSPIVFHQQQHTLHLVS